MDATADPTGGAAGVEAALSRLARFHGVATAYRDIAGRRVVPPAETLVAVLAALGAPVARAADAPAALREGVQAAWRRMAPPVAVAWDGTAASLEVRLPRSRADGRLLVAVVTEDGGTVVRSVDLRALPAARAARVEGRAYVAKRVLLPAPLPHGYHQLVVEAGGHRDETLLLSAPVRAYAPPGYDRRWGVFVPLYALRSERNAGIGDLADLEALLAWAGSMGGHVAGTLPLLSAFLGDPFEPSPYAPASRLFWNEIHLDLSALPGLAFCPEARDILGSPEFARQARALRESPLVDHRAVAALKRRVVEAAARGLLGGPSDPPERYREFLSLTPEVDDYAAFQASVEARRAPWPAWPAPLRDGVPGPGEDDAAARRYHLYAQWAMEEQVSALADRARSRGQSLYLDLPLGVGSDSYDVWRHRELFALDASAGAPPDDFFAKGQDWGFPPLDPERIREDAYDYVRACLRFQMRHAGILRIDHVMGFHRFFWIPRGAAAREGTYVRYPAEEFYALVCLESHRQGTVVIGEDLGTVPPPVRPAMARHGIGRMHVVQFALSPDPGRAIRPVPAGSLAGVNTHDMPPFAAFLAAKDVADRVALEHLDPEAARAEEERRKALVRALREFLARRGHVRDAGADPLDLLAGCLKRLAGSRARIVVANLEDLWLEEEAQNVPGTWRERPNWRRKARHALEELAGLPRVEKILMEVGRLRRGGLTDPPPGRPGGRRRRDPGR